MISATNSATPATTSSPSTNKTGTTGLSSDFETFLKMLTAQARNQDPLEPLDSSEYASQLAQFSMVEQQVQTNDLLNSVALALNGANLAELTGWIGMDVRGAPGFQFDGQPVTIFSDPVAGADRTLLVVRNAEGAEVDRIEVPTSENQFLWAGVDAIGNPLPAGNYSATVESYSGDELLSTAPATTFSRVTEAQISDGAIVLTLDGGEVLPASQVSAVRAGA